MNGRRPGAENADHGKNSKPSNQAPARRAPSERGVNQQRAPDRAIVMITHYQRLLGYVEPDRVQRLMAVVVGVTEHLSRAVGARRMKGSPTRQDRHCQRER